MNKNLLSLLCCPECRNNLSQGKNIFYCSYCNKKYPFIDDIPNFSLPIQESDIQISQKKWDEKYIKDSKKDIAHELDLLDKKFFNPTWNQIRHYFFPKRGNLFLETGCGTFYFGRHLAKMGFTVVGIDISMQALKSAKLVLEREKLNNYLLVCGSILKMPFKNNSFNLLYGFGVVEHFKDTLLAIQESQRVLKKGGLSYNTVPYLNLGSLTYRQIWGNIPRFPLLEEIFTFIHTKLLKAKHMRFGYELSFTRSYLEKIHQKAGFNKVQTGQFRCQLDFDYLNNQNLKKFAVYLAAHFFLFWPMIYVAAKK